MTDLASQLSSAAGAAFASLGLDPALGQVRRSDRPDLAPFQCSGALAAAKAARKPPREIAQLVATAIASIDGVSVVEVAGPGFINIALTDAKLAERAESIAGDVLAGGGRVKIEHRVVIDYGGPNVAKGMHVGHLRASIIGESLKRIFRFRGDTVWGDAHFGDWGFQMGLMIVTIEDQLDGLDDEAKLDARLKSLTLDDLEAMYPAAAAKAKDDDAFRDRARKATAALQGGEPVHRKIWRAMHDVSMEAQRRDFHALGVDFDLWKGESDSDPLIADMVADLERKHLIVDDQGARIIRVARNSDKRDLPPLLVISSEGSAMYGTTDLATILDRERSFGPDLIVYVVDQRQADHFEIVFRAALLAGYAKEGELEHVGFGTMNGTDGKPFKTRAGGVLKLSDLIGQALEKARERMREGGVGADFSASEFEDVAHKVGVAAIKFADLMNARTTSYVFDLDRFMSFEGKTGPYLLYAVVRIKSVLRKAAEQGLKAGPIHIEAPSERSLVLALDGFDAALTLAYEKRAPHFLAEHVFALSQAWSAFWDQCPILAAPDAQTQASRLALAEAVLKQLTIGLDLLGIAAPERM